MNYMIYEIIVYKIKGIVIIRTTCNDFVYRENDDKLSSFNGLFYLMYDNEEYYAYITKMMGKYQYIFPRNTPVMSKPIESLADFVRSTRSYWPEEYNSKKVDYGTLIYRAKPYHKRISMKNRLADIIITFNDY